VEPNIDRHSLLIERARENGVHISKGTSEHLPFTDGTFDAVVAMWILHYVEDLDRSLTEMARVANPRAPNARIILVQGAPDNEVVNLINKACSSLCDGNKLPSHQGYLLHRAVKIFSAAGFSDVELHRVKAFCNFPEKAISARCSAAAELLSEFWYEGDANLPAMKKNFIPVLERHFEGRPHEIGDEAVMLIAKPFSV
jgi:SAM-dependent methyltransferase